MGVGCRVSGVGFVPFAWRHLGVLALPAAREWYARIKAEPAIGEAYEVEGLAWSLELDGGIAACAGIRPAFDPDAPYQGEVWSLFPPRLPRRAWPPIVAKARAVFARAEAQGYRRLEAYIRADNRFGFTLAETFGFRVEALMQRYGPMDCDTLLMARVRARAAAVQQEEAA